MQYPRKEAVQVAIFIHSNVMFGLGMEKRGLDYQLYYFTHRAAAYSQGWVIFSRPADFLVVLVSNYIQFLGPKGEYVPKFSIDWRQQFRCATRPMKSGISTLR